MTAFAGVTDFAGESRGDNFCRRDRFCSVTAFAGVTDFAGESRETTFAGSMNAVHRYNIVGSKELKHRFIDLYNIDLTLC